LESETIALNRLKRVLYRSGKEVLSEPALILRAQSQPDYKSMDERIENAMRIMANVIVNEGEEYLPIFERLEIERDKLRLKNDALERVLALHNSN